MDATTEFCDCSIYATCIARDLYDDSLSLDHTDAMGYCGAAFRLHTLPREVVCPSVISPRYGFVITSLRQPPGGLSAVLDLALALLRPGQFGEYASGQRAFPVWIELLESPEGSSLYEEQMRAHAQDAGVEIHNRLTLTALVHARNSASLFLERRAEDATGSARKHLVQAAQAFADEVELLRDVGKPDWTRNDRNRQAVALANARDIEATIISLLEKAAGTLSES